MGGKREKREDGKWRLETSQMMMFFHYLGKWKSREKEKGMDVNFNGPT